MRFSCMLAQWASVVTDAFENIQKLQFCLVYKDRTFPEFCTGNGCKELVIFIDGVSDLNKKMKTQSYQAFSRVVKAPRALPSHSILMQSDCLYEFQITQNQSTNWHYLVHFRGSCCKSEFRLQRLQQNHEKHGFGL